MSQLDYKKERIKSLRFWSLLATVVFFLSFIYAYITYRETGVADIVILVTALLSILVVATLEITIFKQIKTL